MSCLSSRQDSTGKFETSLETAGEPDAWKLARPVRGWGGGETPPPTPHNMMVVLLSWEKSGYASQICDRKTASSRKTRLFHRYHQSVQELADEVAPPPLPCGVRTLIVRGHRTTIVVRGSSLRAIRALLGAERAPDPTPLSTKPHPGRG